MAYPPLPYRVKDPDAAIALMRDYPFAHVLTAHCGLRATRVPVLVDVKDGRPFQLRSHFDARNPQAQDLDGARVLVAYSGPAAYVSPNWRADKSKGGTYDYQEVQVRGVARVVQDLSFFMQIIDDLSTLIEPQHKEVADYPVWRTPMSPPGHIERQVSLVTTFFVDIDEVETTFKLHQNFPEADRRAVADHLLRSNRDEARAIANAIRGQVEKAARPPD
jgi:transcriptional regulator